MTGHTILVAGASSGIGRATSILLSRFGARVILVARSRERLEGTVKELEGPNHVVEVFDLTDYESIPAWLLGLTRTHGPLDGLLNCAAKYSLSPLKMMDSNVVEELWRVNVFANLWLAKGVSQRGVSKGGGSIVLVSSVVGMIGQAGLSAYSASKGAVISLTRSLAIELAREKIRVNCIVPSNLKTAMTDVTGPGPSAEDLALVEKEHPLGFGEPADIAYAAAYLLSPAAKWITGTTLVVDGGYTAH